MSMATPEVVKVLQDAADALRNSIPIHLSTTVSNRHMAAYVAVNYAIAALDPSSPQAKIVAGEPAVR